MITIPDALLQDIKSGRVVLFLGAGASIGATNSKGNGPPTGEQLKQLLSDRFLGGKSKDGSLAWVADLAISETDLGTVQDFIADMLRDLVPTTSQAELSRFHWRGIVTTNYDLLIEAIYRSGKRLQNAVPILSDSDSIDEKLRNPSDIALLKLHGCITRTRDPLLPLILTVDQYITHRSNREQLFRTFEEWGAQYPVVFIGHGGQDPDIREILQELSKNLQWRPRYFLVKPGSTDSEVRFWETKRVTVLDGTLDDFIAALDTDFPRAMRPVLKAVDLSHPLKRRFVLSEEVSPQLSEWLTVDLEYVHGALAVAGGNPQDFYRGFDFGWYSVINALDVRRKLTDSMLNDVILRAEEDRPVTAELYVIRAEAGAGKSVFLHRLAWEAATDADVLTLFLRQDGFVQYEALREIYRLTQQRIFLFVDDASRHVAEIGRVVAAARKDKLPLTILTAERVNVWNMLCEGLSNFVTDFFELRYLSHAEIENLVQLLADNDSLGPNLTGRTPEDCVKQFEGHAGRQLLVALHEATFGHPFEEILLHEYEQIQPQAARRLYLTVCVLNRLNVGVRAGFIARVHNIPFGEFKEKLFAPLEHVVSVHRNAATQDFLYAARHQEIAQIVFDRVLKTSADRLREYSRIISQLNLAYTTDRIAFRGLLRAKALNELFPNYDDVRSIFDLAEKVGPHEAFLYQQRANYERLRPSGNLTEAERLLGKARELDPRDLTIVHSLAEIKRTKAEQSPAGLERTRYRNQAKALLVPLIAGGQAGPYARTTLIKIAIDELRDSLGDPTSADEDIDEAVRAVEEHLQKGLQQYPDERYLLTAEAEFGKLLVDHDRSFNALKKAFEANRRDAYIAIRLARLHNNRGEANDAAAVLKEALNSNRGDKQLNFEYAQVLRASSDRDIAALIYHYRRAFTPWDTNYEAQFWFARFAFESREDADRRASKETFAHLREVPLPHEVRTDIRDRLLDGGERKVLFGNVARLEADYCFVERDGSGDWVFCHKRLTALDQWQKLRKGVRVQFNVGFTFQGAQGLDVTPL